MDYCKSFFHWHNTPLQLSHTHTHTKPGPVIKSSSTKQYFLQHPEHLASFPRKWIGSFSLKAMSQQNSTMPLLPHPFILFCWLKFSWERHEELQSPTLGYRSVHLSWSQTSTRPKFLQHPAAFRVGAWCWSGDGSLKTERTHTDNTTTWCYCISTSLRRLTGLIRCHWHFLDIVVVATFIDKQIQSPNHFRSYQ